MKVYFGAAISLDRSRLPVYQAIVAAIKDLGHEVLSEYVVDPGLVPGDGLSAEELFRRETATIERADVMVAEVSSPSWGTAFLMEHALDKGKPVLALFYEETEYNLPMMIQGHPELYLEHYSEDNLKAVLKRNLAYVAAMKRRKGKLVVIDGANGSGKSTQTKLLLDLLKRGKVKHKFISFPRYHTSFHGRHVGRFLKGEFGGQEVNPYLSSLAFALDRLTARDEVQQWLEEGNVVVADRYVSASMAHQGSKLPEERRREFIDWVYDMEYKEHRLPKEDVVIYLYVPTKVAQELLVKSGRELDMEDKDVEHNRKSIEMYRQLVKRFKHWEMVACVNSKGQMSSIEEIHQRIIDILVRRRVLGKKE